MEKADTTQVERTPRGEHSFDAGYLEPVTLTVRQAAAKLQVSRWTVYQLIRKRMLASLKIGRRRYVPHQAVHDLVTRLAQEST